jgi:hypothetical protein
VTHAPALHPSGQFVSVGANVHDGVPPGESQTPAAYVVSVFGPVHVGEGVAPHEKPAQGSMHDELAASHASSSAPQSVV